MVLMAAHVPEQGSGASLLARTRRDGLRGSGSLLHVVSDTVRGSSGMATSRGARHQQACIILAQIQSVVGAAKLQFVKKKVYVRDDE